MAKGEKKIDTWEFTYENETATFDVYIVRPTDGGSGKTSFRAKARSAEFGDGTIDNPNIDELRSAADAWAKQRLARTYDRFFLIKYAGHGRGDVSTFRPDYEPNNRTDSAKSSIDCTIKYITVDDGPIVLFKDHKQGTPRPWRMPTVTSYNFGEQYALISDTPENRAALARIFAGFEDLNKQLKAILNPETINDNFRKLAASEGKFLTAGSVE